MNGFHYFCFVCFSVVQPDNKIWELTSAGPLSINGCVSEMKYITNMLFIKFYHYRTSQRRSFLIISQRESPHTMSYCHTLSLNTRSDHFQITSSPSSPLFTEFNFCPLSNDEKKLWIFGSALWKKHHISLTTQQTFFQSYAHTVLA